MRRLTDGRDGEVERVLSGAGLGRLPGGEDEGIIP